MANKFKLLRECFWLMFMDCKMLFLFVEATLDVEFNVGVDVILLLLFGLTMESFESGEMVVALEEIDDGDDE